MSTKWVCHYFVCPFFGIQFTSQFSRYWDIISFWIDYWNVCFYLPPTFVMCIYLAFFYYITPFPVFHLFVMISLSTLWDFHLHVASKREISSEKVHECPKMSWNVQECPKMSHPCPGLDVVSCILWKDMEASVDKTTGAFLLRLSRHSMITLAKFIWKNVSSYVV